MNILLNTNVVALRVPESTPALAELAKSVEHSEQFVDPSEASTWEAGSPAKCCMSSFRRPVPSDRAAARRRLWNSQAPIKRYH